MVASTEEVLLLVGAFQTAWLSLLEDERLETSNIDRLPGLLMSAILESARGGERDEEKLAAAALRRLELYEFELEQAAAVPLQ